MLLTYLTAMLLRWACKFGAASALGDGGVVHILCMSAPTTGLKFPAKLLTFDGVLKPQQQQRSSCRCRCYCRCAEVKALGAAE
ncbi:hypothetical protein AWZ03_005068 [Drosophila navojoa]|uniref:Secreted protein n=1 Tax=Drosophila navojoa TaxID=7232 RepID=A0A484BIM7_DRONA|nr:hypothetical protein AWZ03_005068 [Drosophila navojoa]